MSISMTIGIPSSNRSEILRDNTLKSIPDSWAKNVMILVPKSQYKDYVSTLPEWKSCIVSEKDDAIRGAGRAKQWLVDNVDTKGLFIVDDDIKILKRKRIDADRTTTSKASEEETEECFDMLTKWLKHKRVGQVGIGCSWMNHVRPDVVENTMCGVFVGMKPELLHKTGLRHGDFPYVFSDTFTTLSLIVKGYKVRLTFEYLISALPVNYAGGCSDNRTIDRTLHYAKRFVKIHSDYAKVYQRKSGMYNVRIQWKKAEKNGIIKKIS